MPVSDEKIAEYKEGLRKKSDEKLQLDLDTNSISHEWRRSLAEMELRRRGEEERATRFNAQESTRENAQQFQVFSHFSPSLCTSEKCRCHLILC